MDDRSARDSLYEILAEEGFRPTIDEDDDIVFRHESRTICAIVEPDDAEFVRLVLPNIHELSDGEEWNRGVLAAMLASQRVKVAQVAVVDQQTHVSAEFFLAEPDQLRPLLERYLRALEAGALAFGESMQELEELTELAEEDEASGL